MPRVWTLRQPGINSPAPARSREQGQPEKATGPGRRDGGLEAERPLALAAAEPERIGAHTPVSVGGAILAPAVALAG